jgi:CrcB protein
MRVQLSSILAVFCGAGIGALCRWLLGLAFNPVVPSLPLGTLAANLSGGLVMGVVLACFDHYQSIPPAMRLLLTTGFLGGLTTFSTFSGESATLLLRQQFGWMSVHLLAHVVGSVACTLAGIGLVRLLVARQ